MTPTEATTLLRMLAPVGGVRPAEPEPLERARQCRRLLTHLKSDGGYIPKWLSREVANVVV